MRILAGMVCGFVGFLLGAFCGGVIILVMISAAGDDLPFALLLAIGAIPTLLFAVLGAAFGFVVSSGADEFSLRPPLEDHDDAVYQNAEIVRAGVSSPAAEQPVVPPPPPAGRGETFLPDDPVPPPLPDDGIFVAELVEESPGPSQPFHPSWTPPPLRPPVTTAPPRAPRRWPSGWAITGIVFGVLAIAPAASAAVLVSRTAMGAVSLGVFAALFFLPGLLCMATALWGDFTKARVLRAGKVGVLSGLILNGGAFLAVAFAGVVALHSDILPPSEKTLAAQRKLVEARDKRIEQTRELRLAAAPPVSPGPKPGTTTPRPVTRPSADPSEPPTTAVRLATGSIKATPSFEEKPDAGAKTVISGATFTTLDLVRSPVTVPPVWSQSGKQFYTVERDGFIRRISSEDLLQTHEIKIEGVNSMTMTRKGLVITRPSQGDVILLEPTSLRPLKRYILPGVKGATGGALSDTVYLWFSYSGRDTPAGGYLLNLETQDAFPQATRIMGNWFAMTPTGDFVLSGDSSQLRRYGVGREELKLHQASTRIGSSPRNIDLSPDGKYVALPSGGGNRTTSPSMRRMNYGTYIFEVDNLAKPVASIVSGPYPRTVSYDPRSEVFYAQASGTPLMVFSPEGTLVRRYAGGGLRIETDRIITSPQGGQMLLMGSSKLIHVSAPPPKLPGADVFGGRVTAPTRLDLATPALPAISPPEFDGDARTVMLPAAVSSVTAAAGGRYYLMYLPEVGQVAVFDVNKAAVIRYLPVHPAAASTPADKLMIAAAADYFVALDPDTLQASRWSLKTFKLEKVETLSSLVEPVSICMGAASQGPLLVATRKGYHFYDLETLLEVDLLETSTTYPLSQTSIVRASANGRVFTLNAGAFRRRNMLTRLEIGPDRVSARRMNPYTSIPLPDYDGANIYSTAGQYNQRDIYRRPASASSSLGPFSLVMPPVRGVLGLQFNVPEQTRVLPDASSAPLIEANVQLVALRSGGREVMEIGDLNDGREVVLAYNTRDLTPSSLVLPFDQRFFISAPAEIYGYIPLSRDRIEVRKIDVKRLARDRRGRFLFFTSEAPSTAKAGTDFSYQVKVQSSSENVRYTLLPRRPGMNIDRNGKLTWRVPTVTRPIETFTIMAIGEGATATQMVRLRVEP